MALFRPLPGIEAIDRSIRERAIEEFSKTLRLYFDGAPGCAPYFWTERERVAATTPNIHPVFCCPLGWVINASARDSEFEKRDLFANPVASLAFKRITGKRATADDYKTYRLYYAFTVRFDERTLTLDDIRSAFGLIEP